LASLPLFWSSLSPAYSEVVYSLSHKNLTTLWAKLVHAYFDDHINRTELNTYATLLENPVNSFTQVYAISINEQIASNMHFRYEEQQKWKLIIANAWNTIDALLSYFGSLHHTGFSSLFGCQKIFSGKHGAIYTTLFYMLTRGGFKGSCKFGGLNDDKKTHFTANNPWSTIPAVPNSASQWLLVSHVTQSEH
jgi:hypothetical protein